MIVGGREAAVLRLEEHSKAWWLGLENGSCLLPGALNLNTLRGVG